MSKLKTYRSGTQLTEEQRQKAGFYQKKIRLSLKAIALLEDASERLDKSQGEIVEFLICREFDGPF